MLRGSLTAFFLLAGVIVACSAPLKAEKLCTPDANVFCRCTDRAEGTKKCKADGQSFEACLPCDGSGDKGPGSASTDPFGKPKGDDDDDDDKDTGTDTSEDELKSSKTPTEDTQKKDAGSSGTSSGGTSSGGTSSGGTSSGKSPDSNVNFPDTPHCKPLKNVAPKVEAQKLADEATAPKGGQAADGLYVQAWVVQFTGSDGESGPSKHYSKGTMELMGDVGRYAFEDADTGKNEQGGFRISPVEGKNKISIAYECPAAAPKELAYDATDSTIILYDPPYARVFYKQKESK